MDDFTFADEVSSVSIVSATKVCCRAVSTSVVLILVSVSLESTITGFLYDDPYCPANPTKSTKTPIGDNCRSIYSYN